jgi:Na+/proline symporter
LISDGKLKAVDFTWDFSKSTFWVIMLYWVGSLKNYISNQTIIQRYMTTRDEKQAAKGIWFANLLNIPIIWLFLLLGTALYLYYSQNPQKANPVMDQPDALLPWFIMLELPAGVAGLLIAGIFAASMSTLESSLNSMSTVMVTDFYKQYSKKASDLKSVKLGKVFVVILGLTGTVAGLILATQQIQSLYDKFFELIGLFGGGLGGLFLLGMMTEKANAKGTLIGFALSAVFQFYITNYTSLSFFTYLFMGMMSCFLFGYLFSLIFPTNQKNIDGLTIHTLNNR